MARTAYEAVAEYLDGLEQIRSCVTKDIFSVNGRYYEASQNPHALLLARGESVRVAEGLAIRLTQNYLVIRDLDGSFRVSTTAYMYALENLEGREILAFHRHPASPPNDPHLHLGSAAIVQNRDLADAHIPTGRVSVEAFLRLIVNDFGVPALRPDWREVLDETEAKFREVRTWS